MLLFSLLLLLSIAVQRASADDDTPPTTYDACQIIGHEPLKRHPKSRPGTFHGYPRLKLAHDLLDAYIEHHAATLAQIEQGTRSCADLRAVVFKAVAGIGDSSEAMAWVFKHALSSGRLFFLDWQIEVTQPKDAAPMSWADGIASLRTRSNETLLRWDFATAVTDGLLCPQSDVIRSNGMSYQDDGYTVVQQERCEGWDRRVL